MHRFYEKRDNQPVSMIYENPTNLDSFAKFRDQIRKTTEEQKRERNSRNQGQPAGRQTSYLPKPISLLGASTMGSPIKLTEDDLDRLNNLYEGGQGLQGFTQKPSQNVSALPVSF